MMPRLILAFLPVALGLAALPAAAQTMVVTNGVRTYPALTNTTVILSNRCELRLTATNNPMPGCVAHLNSPDAFFAVTGIRPSAVVSSLLAQVRVNGAVASADNNCRVVAYGDGTVIVPHAASFLPLQAFQGPYFTSAATNFGRYTYYTGAGLGALNANLGSFRLKRGYAVTLAEDPDGSGASLNYVAADGDLEIAALPASLQRKVRFVHVVPWRWNSQKGICGDIESGLNLGWKYNWNLNQNSTRDLEYVPIRQNSGWPSLSQNWQTRGSTHLLGYNEPDRPDQANLSVAAALDQWPLLMGTGLRLGSPATSDGGRGSWLYPFMTQADAAGLRVDFVAVHYYWCSNPADPAGAANQFYNFLKDTYDQTRRPIWITEWNNGANWTGCADPTSLQQRDCVAAMIQMLEDTPWVERYALYNWVEDVRRLKWDDGSLTPAGVVYRDQPSRIAYLQTQPDVGTRSFAQFAFDGHARDDSGYANNGVTTGSPAYTNGVRGQALLFDGADTRVTLPPNVARNNAFTFAAWVNWGGGGDWQRIFDFGNSTTQYLFLTPRSGSGTLRFGIRNGATSHSLDAPVLPQHTWRHVAVTLSGNTACLYTNGVLAATSASFSLTPASFAPRCNFLGRSQWPADPHFRGMLDDVLITDYALSAAEVAALLANTPPQFTNAFLVFAPAMEGQPYAGSLAGLAADADSGDTFTFSKPTGPAWLNVAADGTLSGTPPAGARGTNYFTVRVANPGGLSGYAVVAIPVTTASGVWISDASAPWSQTSRWLDGIVASGAGGLADFSTINITADRGVVLDSSRTVGHLKFGDTFGAQNWTVAGGGGNELTLDTGGAAQPTLVVTNTARLAVPVAGVNGFVKSGPGTLILSQSNALSGVLNLDRGIDGNNHDGITRLAHPGAAANVTAFTIRNTSVSTAGGTTLQLDGSLGNLLLTQPVSVTCRNNSTTPTLHNLAGSNTLTGFIALGVGGNLFNLQSDAGTLVFTGTNQYVGSLTGGRSYAFSGAGHHLLFGPILNSTNTAPIGLTKSGSGTLTLEAVNTYTNLTTILGGTLFVNGALTASPVTVASGATLGGAGTISQPVTLAAGATLAPGAPFGTLTFGSPLALPVGGVTRLAVSHDPLTNAQLRVLGLLTRGGTLLVTNLGGPLAAGDTFRLISAGASAGAFAAMHLPPLVYGLMWNTTAFATNGSVAVVPVPPPQLGALTVLPNQMVSLTATGVVGETYLLEGAADLAPPVVWEPIVSTLATNATFTLVDPAATNLSRRFYRLRLQ